MAVILNPPYTKQDVEWFDNANIISAKELQVGDVIEMEYGDFDNIVTGVVDAVYEPKDNSNFWRVDFYYFGSNKVTEAYTMPWGKEKVVGRVVAK
jgi:hypothetical protein